MKASKRIISFILALVMVLGMVITPSPTFASEGRSEIDEEAPYKIETINGKSYKLYKYENVVGTEKPTISFFNLRSGTPNPNPFPEFEKYPVNVVWTAYDLKPEEVGFDIEFEIIENNTGITIAKTYEKITGTGKYFFSKTEGWDTPGISHDPYNWSLGVQDALNYDVSIKFGDRGEFLGGSIRADIAQKAVPLYKAEYFTNDLNKPKIKVQRRDNAKSFADLDINRDNLDDGKYYSFSKFNQNYNYYRGKYVEILKYGPDSVDDLKVSDSEGAQLWGMFVLDASNQPKTKGEFIDTESNNTEYVYNVTGDYKTPYIISVRQKFEVKFDPNGGQWAVADQDKEKDPLVYPIAHSMKVGEVFGPLRAINVPTADNIILPKAADGTDKTFLGWNTDKNADKGMDINSYEIKKNTTFYAIYSEQGKGYVNIKYLDQ